MRFGHWTDEYVMFNVTVIVDVVCLCECLCATAWYAVCLCCICICICLSLLLLVLVQLIACLPLFCCLLYIHISPTTNQYTSQFVSRLYQQQQQQIAVQQYKVRARVRDIFYIRIRHQIFQAQIEAGQTLFVYHISYFYFATTKTTSSKVQNFLFPYSVFCRSNKSNTNRGTLLLNPPQKKSQRKSS